VSGVTVVLTGGVGSGKSTVADMLVARGATLIDADRIAREIVEPGRPAYRAAVERFGQVILNPDGTIDRKALAEIVFSDATALADLNAITHPVIGQEMVERRAAAEASGGVVVLDVPLLKPTHRDQLGFDVVIVVDTPVDIAVSRLIEHRGFERADAEARVAAQMTREERLALADFTIDNSGDREALTTRVERLWSDLQAPAG
jgi:dephospho-CoA kinase